MVIKNCLAYGVMAIGLLGCKDDDQNVIALDLDVPFANAFFVPDDTTNEFTAEIVIPFGEAHMQGPEGIAHYLEHLVASNAFPNEDHVKFEHDYNASTSRVFTNYYMSSKDEQRVLSYLSGVFRPIELDDDFMREELQIVEREHQQRIGENPETIDWIESDAKILEPSQLARSVIGTPASIQSINPQDAISIYHQLYNVKNASIVVSANLSKKEVENLINDAFKDIKIHEEKSAVPLTKPSPKIARTFSKIEKIQSDIAITSLVMDGFESLEEEAAADIAIKFLNNNKPSALSRQLVFDEKLLRDFGCYYDQYNQISIMIVDCWADPKENTPLPEITAKIRDWRATLQKDDENVQSAFEDFRELLIDEYSSYEPADYYADVLYELYDGEDKPASLQNYITALKTVKLQDMLDFYDDMLNADIQYQHDQIKG